MNIEQKRPDKVHELENLVPGMVFDLNGVAQTVLQNEIVLDMSDYTLHKLDDMIENGRFVSKGGRPIEIYDVTITLRQEPNGQLQLS